MAHRVSSQAVADLAAFGITLPRKAAASKRPIISLIRSRIGSFYYPDIRTSEVLARKIWGLAFELFQWASIWLFTASKAATCWVFASPEKYGKLPRSYTSCPLRQHTGPEPHFTMANLPRGRLWEVVLCALISATVNRLAG